MSEMPGAVYPPKWHPDPFGRFQYRWYDGDKWTEWVSNHGQKTTDSPISHGVPPVPGQPMAPQTIVVQTAKTNSNAIASLVLSILWLAGIGALLAVLIGSSARKEIRNSGEGGDGLAQAGILLGVLGVAGAIFFWYAIYQASQTTYCSPYDYSC